tara:strand:+ start:1898 stop:2731 length:834 start_codon:yes stop_codon:yes gene_type:complete
MRKRKTVNKKKLSTGKAVQEKKTQSVATVTLDSLEALSGRGLQNVSNDTMATPRIKILMQLSPELEEIEGAKAGMIYNTVTQELYKSDEGLRVVPCYFQLQYVEWADRGQGSGAPINVYDANSDILMKTKRDDQNKDRLDTGNYIDTCHNHFVLVIGKDDVPSPAVITFKSTQLKHSKRWNTMMKRQFLKGKNGNLFAAPAFAHVYKWTTMKESNDKGTWYGWNGPTKEAVLTELPNGGELLSMAKEFEESCRKGERNVSYEEAETSSDTTDSSIPF